MAIGRKTGGRQKGALNKRTSELKAQSAEAIKRIALSIPLAFEGDAHAFMVSLYKNPTVPIEIRLDAAKSAAPYEKPRLSAVDMNATVKRDIEDFTYDELAIIASAGGDGSYQEDEEDRGSARQSH